MRKSTITLAVVGTVLTIGYLAEATRYPMGTLAQPGAGFYPLLVGALLFIGLVGTGIQAVRSQSSEPVDWPRGSAKWRVLSIVIACVGYVIVVPIIGHMASGALIAFAVLQVMHLNPLPLRIVLSIVFGVVSYYLFAEMLGVPMLIGSLFD